MSIQLDDLSGEVDKLHALLHDEDGRGTWGWNMFLHERLQNVAALLVKAGYALPIESEAS